MQSLADDEVIVARRPALPQGSVRHVLTAMSSGSRIQVLW
jgi:hypothetical protein